MEKYEYATVEHVNGIYVLTVSNEPIEINRWVHSNVLFDVSFEINKNKLLEISGIERIYDFTEITFSKEYLSLVHEKYIKHIPFLKTKYVSGWVFYKEKSAYKTKVSNYQIIYL